jgi:hypothetical protein
MAYIVFHPALFSGIWNVMNMNKGLCCITLWLLFITPVLLPAQISATASPAAELDLMLETPAVTRLQALRFVMASVPSPGAAEDDRLPGKTAPNDPVTLGELSFFLMRAFNMKGGFMYALLPGPRYAFRAMVSRSLIQGAADPAMTVSGERFLHILGNVLNFAGGES